MDTNSTAGKNGLVSNPNIVPLIDVLLVLIIIFMVITPQISAGLSAFVPQPPQSTQTIDRGTIVVQVMPGGRLMINQDATDWDLLGTRLAEVFKHRAYKVAFVKGAEEVPFADVAHAIDVMRAAGIGHVGLITSATLPNENLPD